MSLTLLEKLELKDEKSILIQGLPSSIEKQFAKLAFAKNVTPLLKIKKIDFALVFAVNETQLRGIIHEVLPALSKGGKFWVAYPKTSSKIATTLNRECSWSCITNAGFEGISEITLDHVWTATRFEKAALATPAKPIENLRRLIAILKAPWSVNSQTCRMSPLQMFARGMDRRSFQEVRPDIADLCARLHMYPTSARDPLDEGDLRALRQPGEELAR